MLIHVILFTVAFADDKQPELAYEPTSVYREQRVEGWLTRINKQLDEKENVELRDKMVRLLGEQLYQVTRVVPAEALEKLRKIPIWVELAHPKHPCMCYHPSKDWLKSNGMNPDKAGGVELANCKNFLSWTIAQPWMVFHELAHGYHHQVLTFEHAAVKACFDEATKAKIYESVLHINGRKQKHYALTNEKEYFAELSECYFGTNDFFPFVKAELKEYDPRMFDLLGEVWGVVKSKNKKE
jgi:hypothetical protein